jgi:hypothetical protein
VLHVAVGLLPPPLTLTVLHSTVVPSLNVTLPVGVWPVTVAVSVTLWPNTAVAALDVNAVPLVAAPIVTLCVASLAAR